MHPAPVDPDLPLLQSLYDRGKYVAAWQEAQKSIPFSEWQGSAQCTLAARLLDNLEAPRLARALHNRAWRADRSSPSAAYFRACIIARRLGPLRALRFLDKQPEFPNADPEIRASFRAMRMLLLSSFRDTRAVEKLWAETLALGADFAWCWVERSCALESLDAYDEAIAASQRALQLRPNYRPAIQGLAHLYSITARDDEAIALLQSATETIESPDIAAQLAALFTEHHRYEEALVQFQRYRELAVAIEPANVAWWHARMSDTRYELGEITRAGEHARLAKNGFHEQIADRLLHPPADARVVKLAVPFVRQHNMTCAPATLSALSRFSNVPVDHLELAREICYDGTQPFRERQWSEQNGFISREFTVTWDIALALLDRGIPFAIGTVETRSAHLQAIMGYDGIRGSLIVRDPYLKHPGEVIGPKWLESYAYCGPRGMLILPQGEAARLEGLTLPDSELYDHYHEVASALHIHARDRAAQALAALEASAPDHRITWEARRDLAWYDSNQPQALAATEALLAMFPDCNRLKWARYNALAGLSRQTDRAILLAELARSDASEPAFWREYGAELQRDARRLPEARRWLLRALRYQATDAENLHTMAGILWDERRFPEACALYRFAATSRPKVEYLQRSWFAAARHLHLDDEVLATVEERATREAKRSGSPAQTLFHALSRLGRDHDALAALDRAIAARPEDGSLLCFAADAFARHGQAERAATLLAQAESRSARGEWLRCAARIADYKPDPAEALRLYLLATPDDPSDVELHEIIARLYAETQGSERALDHLRQQIARFPHHLGFREAFIRRSRGYSAVSCEAPLRELLDLAPENVWALRELALVLTELNRAVEALEWCDKAVALTPLDDSSRGIRASILLAAGRRAEAADEARAALRLSVDYTSAFVTLVDAAETFAEKHSALTFILEELKRQTVFGDGLLEYRNQAFRILEPAELVENLRGAHAARPDLWHAWSALITQLCDMQRAAEALPLALKATERFPLSARVWTDLARVHYEQRNFDASVDALQHASHLSPAWGYVSRLLADGLQRLERYDDAQICLEEAISAAPLDPQNYIDLADLVWRRSRSPRAIELLTHAIRLNPDYIAAWEILRACLPPASEIAIELARSLTETRAGETAPWIRLAETLPQKSVDERMAALDRAVALEPRNLAAHDLRASILADSGRYEEALAACDPAAFGGRPPRELSGRAAWIIARRGNIRDGISRLRQVVKTESDFYWAWERIAEWSGALGDHQAEREAAERMARLNPRGAAPLGYLADAMMKLGQRDQAIEVLRRAFALEPSYGYAGFTVFDEQLRRRKLPEAAETLARLQQHLPGPSTHAAAARLAIAKGDKTDALTRLRHLLTVEDQDRHALIQTGEALIAAGYSLDAENLVWGEHEQPGVNAAAGEIWVRSFMQRQKWAHWRKVNKLAPDTEFARGAMRELARMCGQTKRPDILKSFVRRHRAWLQQDPDGWGLVGYAWIDCAQWQRALQWFGDWRARAELEPWMLSNIALTLERLGREDEAMEARARALALPRDHSSAEHVTRLCALEAIRGQTEAVHARLAHIDYEALDPRPKAEWAMARLLADLAATPAEKRPDAAQGERLRFYDNHPVVHRDARLKPLLRRFEQAVANLAGTKRRRPIKSRTASPRRADEISGATIIYIILLALLILSRCARM